MIKAPIDWSKVVDTYSHNMPWTRPPAQDCQVSHILVTYTIHFTGRRVSELLQAQTPATITARSLRDKLATKSTALVKGKRGLVEFLKEAHRFSCHKVWKETIWSLFPHIIKMYRAFKRNSKQAKECDFQRKGAYYYEIKKIEIRTKHE